MLLRGSGMENIVANTKKGGNLLAKNEGKKKFQWTKKKIIAASIIGAAILAAIIFVIIVLAMNLGPVRPIESTEEEARVVGEVGGYEVRYEELRYITLIHRASLDKELGKYDTLDAEGKAAYEAALEERVLADIENNYVVLALCEKYGIKTDTAYVNNQVQKMIEALVDAPVEEEGFGGDKDKYVAWLKENNLTDSFLRLMYKVDYLENQLYDYFVENKIDIEYYSENKAEFVKYVMDSEDWVRTIHVYYPYKHPFTSSKNVPAGADKEKVEDTIKAYDATAEAEKWYDKVASANSDESRLKAMKSAIGANFITDFSFTGNGLYFTRKQMDARYESAAFALDMYEVSEIFEYEDGYCFMMRLPLDEEDVKRNVDDLLSQYHYLALKKQLDGKREELSFSGNEYFASISLIDIK